MKKTIKFLYASIALLCSFSCVDQTALDYDGIGGLPPVGEKIIDTYEWPTEIGQTKLSEYYKIWVKVEGEEEQELQVVQSDPIVKAYGNKEDYNAVYTKQRSFSFVNISYDETSGKSLTFRIESLFTSAPAVNLAPRSYNLKATTSGNTATFTVNKNNRYISIDFDTPENKVKVDSKYDWIKHMLCIFIDPIESNVPNLAATTVVPFSESVTAEQLAAAKVIYFAPGYYNLKDSKNLKNGVVNEYGRLTTQPGQMVYIAGGAFVEGHIVRSAYKDQQIIKGRGILSGRQYLWQTPPIAPGNKYEIMEMVMGGENSIYEGVSVIESPQHGMVATQNCTYDNIKFLGWHCNNDGLRPGVNSKITNCFIRACDDFFYDYKLTVKDCVLWPAFNGSILTTGWANFTLGGSLLEDIDIINPEWLSMGNNKGLIMSQNKYEFKPTLSNGVTTLRNIRFEGAIPGFVNLKPNSDYDKNDTGEYAPVTDISKLGWLGNILLDNVRIDEHRGEERNNRMKTNLIKGAKGAKIVEGVSDAIWWVKDVTFKDVYFGDEKLTNENKETYFTIDTNTTANIVFE